MIAPWEQRVLSAFSGKPSEQTCAQLRKSFKMPLPRGINWDWINRSWQAYIYLNGRKIAIARCKKQKDAQAARLRAENFVRKHLLGEEK
jgi:hypothetical protein